MLEGPDEARIYRESLNDSHPFEPLEEEHYNAIILSNPGPEEYVLEVGIHRYGRNLAYLPRPRGDVTVRDFMTIVSNFYSSFILLDELEALDDDDFRYVKSARERVKRGEDVYYFELMGSLIFYEGIQILNKIVILNLGS